MKEENKNIENKASNADRFIGQVDAQVRLPSKDNAILIMWEDGFKNVKIDMTHYLWDMLKCMEEESLLFTKKSIDGWNLSVTIEMEKAT